MSRVIEDDIGSLAGVEGLAFKPTPVALLQPAEEMQPAIGTGRVHHAMVGDRIAVAIGNGEHVFAALLEPAEAERFATRLLRAAALAQSEGSA